MVLVIANIAQYSNINGDTIKIVLPKYELFQDQLNNTQKNRPQKRSEKNYFLVGSHSTIKKSHISWIDFPSIFAFFKSISAEEYSKFA